MAAPAQRPPPPEPKAPAPEEDARLLDALRRGDEAAFETLVRRHSGPLLAATRRILRNDEDAREALQDAFLSAFKAIGSFEGGARLTTWLHRIAVNAALMKLRTKRRHPESSIEEMLPRFQADGHPVEPNEPWTEAASELASRAETRALVRKTIDEMPDSYRTVLLLRDIEELSTEETARMLEATPNAIKIRLHRARQALRARLDQRLKMAPPS
jgi:RNA polymerase sigma-70 factor (ECF subfamily)